MMRLIKLELLQCKYQYMTLMIVVLCGFFLIGFGGYQLEYVNLSYGADIELLVANIYGITAAVFTFGVGILCFVVLVRVFTTFANSMFNHNGYLYNTLPVTSFELVGSKITAAIIWLMIFGIVLIASMIVMVFGIVLAALLDNREIFFELVSSIELAQIIEVCVDMYRMIFDGNGYYLFQMVMTMISMISIGYTIITLVHLPLIQQMKRALRYILYLVIIVLVILAMEYIHIPLLQPWMIMTILGIMGYLGTSYLVAHKIDVAA